MEGQPNLSFVITSPQQGPGHGGRRKGAELLLSEDLETKCDFFAVFCSAAAFHHNATFLCSTSEHQPTLGRVLMSHLLHSPRMALSLRWAGPSLAQCLQETWAVAVSILPCTNCCCWSQLDHVSAPVSSAGGAARLRVCTCPAAPARGCQSC